MKSGHRGSILLLFLLLVLVIFAFIALAVDTAIFSAAKNQHQNATDFSALGAIKAQAAAVEAERDTVDRVVANEKILDAVENAAKDYLQQNVESYAARFLREETADPIDEVEVTQGCWFFRDPGCSTATLDEPATTCGPARYKSAASCPCQGGEFIGPCFLPFEKDESKPGTAVRVRYSTKPESPVRALFGRIFSHRGGMFGNSGDIPRQAMYSESIATFTPKQLVLLVDITKTVGEDDHHTLSRCTDPQRPFNFPGEYPGDAVYELRGECPTGSLVSNPEPSYETVPPKASRSLNKLMWVHQSPHNGNVWYQCIEYTTSSIATPVGRWRDYQCINDRTYHVEGKQFTRSFIVDNVRRAEPLTSILESVQALLRRYDTTTVTGDGIAMFGFDSEFVDERSMVIRDPANPASIRLLSKLDDPALFQDWLTSLDVRRPFDVPGDKNDRADRLLFYRYSTSSGDAAWSNIPMALRKARDLLDSSSGSIAQRSVLLFTDGKTYCTNTGGVSCRNTPEQFKNSMDEIQNIISGNDENKGSYVSRSLPLHVFLYGDTVRPHTVILPKADGSGCMNQDEAEAYLRNPARKKGWDFKWANASHDPPDSYSFYPQKIPDGGYWQEPTAFMYDANGFYDFVSSSGGVWAPIRPCYKIWKSVNTFDCVDADYTPNMERFCKNWPLGKPMVLPPWSSLTGLLQHDNAGRLWGDPKNRSKAEQIQDYIKDKVLKTADYILVTE